MQDLRLKSVIHQPRAPIGDGDGNQRKIHPNASVFFTFVCPYGLRTACGRCLSALRFPPTVLGQLLGFDPGRDIFAAIKEYIKLPALTSGRIH